MARRTGPSSSKSRWAGVDLGKMKRDTIARRAAAPTAPAPKAPVDPNSLLAVCPACGSTVSKHRSGGLAAHKKKLRGGDWCDGGRKPTARQVGSKKYTKKGAQVVTRIVRGGLPGLGKRS